MPENHERDAAVRRANALASIELSRGPYRSHAERLRALILTGALRFDPEPRR